MVNKMKEKMTKEYKVFDKYDKNGESIADTYENDPTNFELPKLLLWFKNLKTIYIYGTSIKPEEDSQISQKIEINNTKPMELKPLFMGIA